MIRALLFAALDKAVDESFAAKKELLTELAFALGVLNTISNENELLSHIKQAKGSTESLFEYRIIDENGRRGIEVSLRSKIIDVEGFPFKVFDGDNVNQIVNAYVCHKG